jgi:hypothetical protein
MKQELSMEALLRKCRAADEALAELLMDPNLRRVIAHGQPGVEEAHNLRNALTSISQMRISALFQIKNENADER